MNGVFGCSREDLADMRSRAVKPGWGRRPALDVLSRERVSTTSQIARSLSRTIDATERLLYRLRAEGLVDNEAVGSRASMRWMVCE